MIGRFACLFAVVVVATTTTTAQTNRPFAKHGRILQEFLQEARNKQQHRELQTPDLLGNVAQGARLDCSLLDEAFKQPAWESASCSCRPGGNDEVVATCIDSFECCAREPTSVGEDVCVANSFQQVIDRDTYGALDTTEYFHYTSGREGTITLFHLVTETDSTCSLHIDQTRCKSCDVIECGGEFQPLFDCTNIQGVSNTFDFCPGDVVDGIDTNTVIGALQDGYIDYQANCRPLPGFDSMQLGGLHELMGQQLSGTPTARTATVAVVATAVVGMLFL